MKKHLPLASSAFLFAGLAFLFACNSGPKAHTPLEDSLAKVNTGMNTQLKEKDSLIYTKEEAMTEFIHSFNDIQDNLNKIKEKEKIITNNSGSVEFKKSNKDQIIGDIQLIYDLLNKNKQRLASVTKKLKDANLQNQDLETACVNLTNQLLDKETDISDLKDKLVKLNVDLSTLKTQYAEEKQEADLKTEALNTGHYVVGRAKELARKGLITKEGGFIGLGKVIEMSKTVDQNYFNKIDITQTTEIPLSGKRAKVVTTHPGDSYKLIETAGVYSKLEILDADKFWSASKYLIVTTD